MRTTPHRRGKEKYISERIYEIITYDDSDTLNTSVILSFIFNKFPGVEYAYALHDKDVYTKGENKGQLKKPHTHILIRFEREKSINIVAKELCIEVHDINWKAEWEYSVQYLIHQNAPEKYQYDKSIINSNCDIDELLSTRSTKKEEREDKERTELSVIMEYISIHDGIVTMYMLYKFCLDNEIWSTYRRNYSIIKDMIFEGREWKKHGKETYWYEKI